MSEKFCTVIWWLSILSIFVCWCCVKGLSISSKYSIIKWPLQIDISKTDQKTVCVELYSLTQKYSMNKPHEEVLNPADAQIPCRAWRIWGHSSSVICAVWSWELVMKTMNILKAGLLLERYLINFLCLHEGQIGMLVIIYEQQCVLWFIFSCCCCVLKMLEFNDVKFFKWTFGVPCLHTFWLRILIILSANLFSIPNHCDFHARKPFSLVSTHFPLMISLVVYFSCFIDLNVESRQCFLTFLPPLYPDYLVDMLQRFAGYPYEMLSLISHTQVHEGTSVLLKDFTRCVVWCQLPCKVGWAIRHN